MFINLWIARGGPAENPRSTSTQDGPGREKTSTGAAVDVLRSRPAPVEEQHDDGDVVVEVPPVALLDAAESPPPAQFEHTYQAEDQRGCLAAAASRKGYLVGG
uniref:Uncharacterized protein n=1 Tax=Setaria viridis TaxID=4556 RepID=A0A4U6TKA5_SETVI|nr:hypothetical protein SEVIR_8G176400v2 [Setaria viridis]